ncbi:MAG: DUF58 domain-containing protein [Candidatus Muiribacteriaceae bacterium]
MRYISQKDLYTLKNLKIIARKVVEGFLYGLHKSPYSGVNIEFSEYRPYTFGDELKNIDWKLWGKTDRLYIKKFEEETNMRVWLMNDSSSSMDFTSGEYPTKLFYSHILTTAFSYLFLSQQDAVGLVTFTDRINDILYPDLKQSQFSGIIKTLENTECSGRTDLRRSFSYFSNFIKKRGLIIIISDFIDNNENLKKAISYFRHKKNDLFVFHIYDRAESNLPYSGKKIFVDPESGEILEENADSIRERYKKEFHGNIHNIRKICRENRIFFYSVCTDEDPVNVMKNVFRRRR